MANIDNSASDEEPETPESARDHIYMMLSAMAYHRVRVAKLSDYDKVIGGIAWAISRCDNGEVAVDLLYEESPDQNIKLRTDQSEKIIEALNGMECPIQLSAHQILGLDFLALRNVVQWLVRRLLNPQNEQRYAPFTDWFSMDHQNSMEAKKEFKKRLRSFGKQKTSRFMKRWDSSIVYDLNMDAKCTLAEYVNYARNGGMEDRQEEVEEGGKENLQEASTKKHVPTHTVREMMDEAIVEEIFKNDDATMIESRNKLCRMIDDFNIPHRLASLEKRLIQEGISYQNSKKMNKKLNENYQKLMEEVEAPRTDAERQQVKEIFESFQNTELRAAELREHVIADLKKCQRQEDNFRRNIDEFGNIQKYDAYRREIAEVFAEKTKQNGRAVKETITIQFRLDRIMNAALSSHYRKRNMERLQESSSLTQEAKTAVIDFNVTIDILKFSARINGFIDEVEKTLTAQPATQEYRDAFVSYMNDVRVQLGEYHWKAKLTLDKSQEEKTALSKIRAEIREKEREVLFTTAEMTKLLRINKILQDTIQSIEVMEENSSSLIDYCIQQADAAEAAAEAAKNQQ